MDGGIVRGCVDGIGIDGGKLKRGNGVSVCFECWYYGVRVVFFVFVIFGFDWFLGCIEDIYGFFFIVGKDDWFVFCWMEVYWVDVLWNNFNVCFVLVNLGLGELMYYG